MSLSCKGYCTQAFVPKLRPDIQDSCQTWVVAGSWAPVLCPVRVCRECYSPLTTAVAFMAHPGNSVVSGVYVRRTIINHGRTTPPPSPPPPSRAIFLPYPGLLSPMVGFATKGLEIVQIEEHLVPPGVLKPPPVGRRTRPTAQLCWDFFCVRAHSGCAQN